MATITDIIKNAAEKNGLGFSCGFPSQMTASRLSFPMVWLEHPEVAAKEGRDEGHVSYGIKLHVMALNKNYSQHEKERMISALENAAMALFDSVAEDPGIAATSKFRGSPSESAFTNYGEISFSVTFQADKIFCRHNNLKSSAI